jgi:hypothetical protein
MDSPSSRVRWRATLPSCPFFRYWYLLRGPTVKPNRLRHGYAAHPLAISSGVDRPAVLDYSKKRLLAEGHSMKEVASILQITKRTVAAHKYAVMDLLQLKTNAELVLDAIKHRIISI